MKNLRTPTLFGAIAALVVIALVSYSAYVVSSASAQTPPRPPAPPTVLGSPANLTAAPGAAEQILLRWTPGANAEIHLAYHVRADGSEGAFSPMLAGGADSAVIEGLTPTVPYLFIVIAGRSAGAGGYEWSDWSNWARATPGLPAPPPLPTPAPTDRATDPNDATPTPGPKRWVEVEGTVISVDADADTFQMRISEYEYFGDSVPASPITINYRRSVSAESWLSAGKYVEAEGYYDAATNTIDAYEIDDDSDSGSGAPGPRRWVEVEGIVMSVDVNADTFKMQIWEYEYFGASVPASPITISYQNSSSAESWLSAGKYVEAEGYYNPALNTIDAHEIEAESYYEDGDSDDDDDDDDDDDSDDDDDD